MQPDHIYINIEYYCKITQCDDKFSNTHQWDEQHGISIAPMDAAEGRMHVFHFKFTITDAQKYAWARVKYGI
jgi:hypothetical protein